jgi:glycosyltransferase involved in cell wall biosynthesis
MQQVIYTDLRCLQDRDFQRRGIGYHTASLLRARANSPFAGCKLVGLTDPQMPDVPADLTHVVDEISSCLNPVLNGEPVILLEGSPMTHDTRFTACLINHPAVVKLAVIYDFIPCDWPGYLPAVHNRIEYSAKIARLNKFDLVFPISAYSAWRLRELTGLRESSIVVTGACVRESLYEAKRHIGFVTPPYEQAEPYFVTLGGDDRRKNTDLAIRAVKRLNLLFGKRIPLKVIGFYCDGYKADLLRQAGHEEGCGFVELYPNISDAEVVRVHAGAVAAICPSRIEGFSLPVVEAAVCECPVLASTCAAQLELITQPEALFHSEDAEQLAERLEALFVDPNLRKRLVDQQAHLASKFHASQVGARFWDAVEKGLARRHVSRSVRSRARVALVSPFPPDTSSAAFYAANILRSVNGNLPIDLYSDSQRPLHFDDNIYDAKPVSVAPLINGFYNASLLMLDNEPGHARTLQLADQYGGACVLHDLRMLRSYFELHGPDRFCEFAASFLGRTIDIAEARQWVNDPACTLLFLDKLVRQAAPLMVHSPAQRAILKKRYGVDSQLLPSCPAMTFTGEEWETAPGAFRSSIAADPDDFVIAVFGTVSRRRGMETAILSIDLLRSWHMPARLFFVGDDHPPAADINRLADQYEMAEFVHFGPRFAGMEATRSFLLGADVGLQLRDYEFGLPSPEVLNCISAGLPCVTTNDSKEAADAPAYIRSVPDFFSPLLVAEELALVWENKRERSSDAEARSTYLSEHNFSRYVQRLTEFLHLA